MRNRQLCLLPLILAVLLPGPAAAQIPRPNILLVIADDASFPHFGAYGSTWVETPAFDRIADEGLLFLNAYTPNAKCAPSRSAILTGRDPWQLEEAGNFGAFLDAVPAGQPFSFWFGAHEPHRAYEYGTGVRVGGKRLSDIEAVPTFWPDNDTVRNDMLDYAFEIEHFDRHLGRMLEMLEARGLLESTLVVVTSDNGMPFPRSKGQEYELSGHMPLAVMWPRGIRNPGRRVSDFEKEPIERR